MWSSLSMHVLHIHACLCDSSMYNFQIEYEGLQSCASCRNGYSRHSCTTMMPGCGLHLHCNPLSQKCLTIAERLILT